MKVLLFSPHAYISVHAIPEALVAQSLLNQGIEVIQVGCGGAYQSYCISMSAAGVWATDSESIKVEICKKCKTNRQDLLERFNFHHIEIDSFIRAGDATVIEELLKDVRRDNWADFTYKSIEVGKFAAYEFLLNYKINTTCLSEEQFLIYLIQLKNALTTLIAGERIFDYVNPDRFLVYHGLYSINHIMGAIAQQRGIGFYSLHAGSNLFYQLSEMTVFEGTKSQYLTGRHPSWKSYSKTPLSLKAINRVNLHLDELIKARSPWVYSIISDGKTSEQLRNFFSVEPKQKVLLVTMSSEDEQFAAKIIGAWPTYPEPMFKTQIEWILNIIDWVKIHPEYLLIIRVHPREFPNKREHILSSQATKLKKIFEDLPKNTKVNWPDDKISLHDLLKIVDLGLNATSTAGLELLLFGIPVVIYDSNQSVSYPSELNICPVNQQDYFSSIISALNDGKSIEHIYRVYQWLAFRTEIVSIDILDGFCQKQDSIFVKYTKRVLRKQKIYTPAMKLPGLLLKNGKKLKNEKWLVFAIINKTESHLNDFVASLPESDFLDINLSHSLIKKKIKKIVKNLCKNDPQFIKQFNQLYK